MGYAMPDGSYYIREGPVGVSDLDNAIKAVGRGGADHDDIRKHIIKRANALGKSDMIPDTWNSNGSLKQSAVDVVEESLKHIGVKGMKWGVRRGVGTPRAASSSDAARATALRSQAKSQGTHTLSNEELQHLTTRLNLDQQY